MTLANNPRGSRLSLDWKPSAAEWNYAAEKGFTASEIARIAEEFVNFWTEIPGHRGVKIRWTGAWKNRVMALAERRGFSVSVSKPQRQTIIDVAATLDLGLRSR